MRLFLIWADKGEEFKAFMERLKEAGHEIVYWVGTTEGEKDKLPRTVFHDHFAAWAGNPAGEVESSVFPPPGKDLIHKMYKTESLVLTMMDKKFDTLGVNERRHIYYKMLGYWHSVIEKYRPEAIIFPTVPHTVYNFIIYDLAKMLGIKTLMFEDTWVLDHLLAYENWQEGSKTLQEAINNNVSKDFSLNDLSEDLKSYYLKQTDHKQDATPIYMSHWRKKYSGFNILSNKAKVVKESIRDGTFLGKVTRFIIKRFQSNLEKEYKRLVSAVDFSENFIYVPLSFQPERTTSPQGDMFVDQILMLETLAASLPPNWLIYVKEHPSQWWLRSGVNYSSSRYKGYYEKLALIPAVKLAPIHTNSFELINKSKGVATTTGTAGWEALLRSKPALIFGYPWYRDCPEVFRVSDTESCQQAIQKIAEDHVVDHQRIINFLKSLQEVAIRGYIEGFVDKISKISKEENLKNLGQVVVDWLENNKIKTG